MNADVIMLCSDTHVKWNINDCESADVLLSAVASHLPNVAPTCCIDTNMAYTYFKNSIAYLSITVINLKLSESHRQLSCL